jgi:FdhE protein
MDLSTARAAVEAYRPLLPDDDNARLGFFLDLWEFQQGCRAQVSAAGRDVVPEGAPLAEWYWDEKPLLMLAPLEFDATLLTDALKGCAAHLVKGAGLDVELAHALAGFDWASLTARATGSAPVAFIEDISAGLKAEGRSEAFVQIAALIVALALRPLLEPTADALGATMSSNEQNATHLKPLLCPVCGSHASASRIGDVPSGAKNGRLLFCSLCGMQWEFERIRCSRCGTRNQGKLHYFHIEGDEAHRLYLCDECGGYTRTIFAQNLRVPFSFDVEDVVMARLDHTIQSQATGE